MYNKLIFTSFLTKIKVKSGPPNTAYIDYNLMLLFMHLQLLKVTSSDQKRPQTSANHPPSWAKKQLHCLNYLKTIKTKLNKTIRKYD